MVGGNASTLWDPSILFAYLVLIHGWICQVARLYWLSGILDLPVSFTREAETPPLVWLSAVLRVPKCLRVCFQSAVRVNGTQSRVTSTVTGSMPLGHRCAELVGGLVVVRWRVSAFWSPGAAGMKQTRRRLAAASQPATDITAGSCPAVPVRAISSARSYTCTPSAELAVVLRPKIVVPFCWHWRFASTLCAES